MEQIYYGIDFGACSTAVAKYTLDETGERFTKLGEVEEEPFIGMAAIPYRTTSEPIFGVSVRDNAEALSGEYEIIPSLKKLLGGEGITVGGVRYSAAELISKYFEYIKEHIRSCGGDIIDKAVLTLSSVSTPAERRELKRAALAAGINVRFVSACAAAYTENLPALRSKGTCLLVNWGAAALDVGLMEANGKTISEISLGGSDFGGFDIDELLAEYVHAQLIPEASDAPSIAMMSQAEQLRLYRACEAAKKHFSGDYDEYLIELPDYGSFGDAAVSIRYEDFARLIAPKLTTKVLAAIDAVLLRAKIGLSSVGAVLLLGGSRHIRMLSDALDDIFGSARIIDPTDTDYAAALGAARLGAGGSSALRDDMGIILSDGTVYPILSAGSPLGSSSENITFSLTEDAQSAHFVFVSGDNNFVCGRLKVPTKGFLKENLILSAELTEDRCARIVVTNDSAAKALARSTLEIGSLCFVSELDGSSEQ